MMAPLIYKILPAEEDDLEAAKESSEAKEEVVDAKVVVETDKGNQRRRGFKVLALLGVCVLLAMVCRHCNHHYDMMLMSHRHGVSWLPPTIIN